MRGGKHLVPLYTMKFHHDKVVFVIIGVRDCGVEAILYGGGHSPCLHRGPGVN